MALLGNEWETKLKIVMLKPKLKGMSEGLLLYDPVANVYYTGYENAETIEKYYEVTEKGK